MNDYEFPENFVDVLRLHIEDEPDFSFVLNRPLRPSDNNSTAGIYATLWQPSEFEIGQYDPAISTYGITIQTLAKNATEEEGIVDHSRLAKKIRIMLYRDEELRIQLGQLKTTNDGLTERTQRWGVQQQRFLSNEIDNQFLYLAVTDMWLETEII